MKEPRSCGGAKGSDEANLKIADARRDNVLAMLRAGQPDDELVRLVPFRWEGGYREMITGRFQDRDTKQQYLGSRGVLNRRAEVRLLNAGTCRVRYPGADTGQEESGQHALLAPELANVSSD
jgi:hypothetical protein